MNAASAPVPNSKAAEQRAHEPSMEEILASIRKIIADDQVFPLSARQLSGTAQEDGAAEASDRPWDEAHGQPEHPARSEHAARTDAPLRTQTYPGADASPRADASTRSEPAGRFEPHGDRSSAESASAAPRGGDVRRPADPPAARQPANFHSGLASIFSNERQPARAEEPESRPPAPAPQLVAKPPVGLREAPAAVVLPIDGDRARPVQNDVWAESRKQHAAPVQDNRPLHAPDPDDYDESQARSMRREPHAVQPALRDMTAQQNDPSARRRSDPAEAPQLRAEPQRQEPAQHRPEPSTFRPQAAASGSRPAASHDDRLLSERSDASISSAFQSLATTVSMPEPEAIESITRELLRPMLKQWLDDNLPVMVEKLVRAEIERVARGSR